MLAFIFIFWALHRKWMRKKRQTDRKTAQNKSNSWYIFSISRSSHISILLVNINASFFIFKYRRFFCGLFTSSDCMWWYCCTVWCDRWRRPKQKYFFFRTSCWNWLFTNKLTVNLLKSEKKLDFSIKICRKLFSVLLFERVILILITNLFFNVNVAIGDFDNIYKIDVLVPNRQLVRNFFRNRVRKHVYINKQTLHLRLNQKINKKHSIFNETVVFVFHCCICTLFHVLFKQIFWRWLSFFKWLLVIVAAFV